MRPSRASDAAAVRPSGDTIAREVYKTTTSRLNILKTSPATSGTHIDMAASTPEKEVAQYAAALIAPSSSFNSVEYSVSTCMPIQDLLSDHFDIYYSSLPAHNKSSLR
jgi:hypothetical protein